jgi:hypothetical protein
MDSLTEYRDFFLALPASAFHVLEIRNYGSLVASVVHRYPPFQVELVMAEPNTKVPAHRHPNIDALEVHISGDLRLVIGPTREETDALLEKARPIPEHRARGHSFPIRSTDWHAAIVGRKPAAFWSFQKWTGAVPMTAAGVDWEGKPFSPEHECKSHV